MAVTIGVALLVWWDRHNRRSVIAQSQIQRRAQIDQALAALTRILDPATPNAALNPAVSAHLLAGYQQAYLIAYDQVLLIIAAVLLIGSLLAWFGLPRHATTA